MSNSFSEEVLKPEPWRLTGLPWRNMMRKSSPGRGKSMEVARRREGAWIL